MILYMSDTDNLIIERSNGRIECRYGSRVIDILDPTWNDRKDARIARAWIIKNRWNGSK